MVTAIPRPLALRETGDQKHANACIYTSLKEKEREEREEGGREGEKEGRS